MNTELIDARALREERFGRDDAARQRWEQTAMARAVAVAVIRYRTQHGLSQRALAAALGMAQPHIARLELGEHNPTVEMLQRLAQGLGLCFFLAVAPADRAAELELPEGAETLIDVTAGDGSRVLAGSR